MSPPAATPNFSAKSRAVIPYSSILDVDIKAEQGHEIADNKTNAARQTIPVMPQIAGRSENETVKVSRL